MTVVLEEKIIRLPRGCPLPEGWHYGRLIYEKTDLYGTYDVILIQRARRRNGEDPTPDKEKAAS